MAVSSTFYFLKRKCSWNCIVTYFKYFCSHACFKFLRYFILFVTMWYHLLNYIYNEISVIVVYLCYFYQKLSKDAAHLLMGRSRKDPHSPHRRNFCRSGRGDKIVSDNSKCVRTSEGDRGVNFQFPQWGWYGCFLEWPNLTYIIKHIVSFNKSVKNSQDTQQLLMSRTLYM